MTLLFNIERFTQPRVWHIKTRISDNLPTKLDGLRRSGSQRDEGTERLAPDNDTSLLLIRSHAARREGRAITSDAEQTSASLLAWFLSAQELCVKILRAADSRPYKSCTDSALHCKLKLNGKIVDDHGSYNRWIVNSRPGAE